MKLKPIGTVLNGLSKSPGNWTKVKSRIVLQRKYVAGLYKLNRFKRVWVVFGFHRQRQTILRVHPMHDPEKPLVGVFASRSPTRPNKLGITLVNLLSIKGNVLIVRGLDALNGSPVYDLKPDEEEINY